MREWFLIFSGFAFGFSVARWWAYRRYFGIEDRIVKRLQKEGITILTPKQYGELVDTEGMSEQ